MKIVNKFMFLFMAAAIFASCESANTKKEYKKEALPTQEASSEAADLRIVKLDIQGMTCEIGCAKLIQSKLYKTDGVNFAQIRFSDSSGVVRYDANRLSEEKIMSVVEAAGGGDLYRVRGIAQIAELDTVAN